MVLRDPSDPHRDAAEKVAGLDRRSGSAPRRIRNRGEVADDRVFVEAAPWERDHSGWVRSSVRLGVEIRRFLGCVPDLVGGGTSLARCRRSSSLLHGYTMLEAATGPVL